MAEFTKGPWRTKRYTGHAAKKDFPGSIIAEDGTEVFSGPFNFRSLRGKTNAEAAANARLIAAAPETIESLEGLLARYIDVVSQKGGWNPEEEAEVIAARAAIQKARTP